ncbi:FxsA family protein [Rhodobacteraceae bacterium NNCM2]|nr:FxsA family protein [Coraliihabitans acroporae]
MWIFLALVAVPVIEIALFIKVGGWLGVWPTIAIVFLTAITGLAVLRAQGIAALADLQQRMAEGRDPSSTLAHGALLLVAGLALLIPGFFTDTIGFLLLVPAVRSGVIAWLGARIQVRTVGGMSGGQKHRGGRGRDDPSTIDGEYVDITPPEGQETPGNSGWTKEIGPDKPRD